MTADRRGRARRVIGQHEFVGWYFLLWFFILLVVPLFAVIALLWSVGNRRARERDDWPDRR
jgi:ABC-type multidrug transport system permease subunit